MKPGMMVAGLALVLAGAGARAQITGDVIGVHNLGPGSKSPITGARPDFCVYCHAPHSGGNIGLWNQQLSKQVYTTYTSDTETNTGRQPTLGYSTSQCLSCHDGTVGVGTTVAYGQVTTRGSMNPQDQLGSNMQSSHPFSLMTPLKDHIDLAASLTTSHTTLDPLGAVKLIHGNVECTSCHDPHVQAKDQFSLNFLVRDSSSGQMCLACHDPTRTISSQVNPLEDWATSAHALAVNAKLLPSAGVGFYSTVAQDACVGCHAPHNAGGTSRLLRGQNEQDCIACHNGGSNVSPMPTWENVFSEYDPTKNKIAHPIPSTNNPHDEAEGTLLNNNRHATCVDCHSPHASESVGTSFTPPPNIRVSQKDIAGINESDGVSALTPALNQYQNCLRCHGTSAGEQTLATFGYAPVRAISNGTPLNIIPQFAVSATSSHPVMHTRNSLNSQPSLLANMLNQDGSNSARAVGTQILCTDCHNSDDNREFGGTGPNGPHGSIWPHILERRYEFSTTGGAAPGSTITNPYPNPDLSINGPYAMCGKCHNLTNIIGNNSWNDHGNHISAYGFSCSVCHTAHGVSTQSGVSISGARLINFDTNVVAPYNGQLSYSQTAGVDTCVLVCHQYVHDSSGNVTPVAALQKAPVIKR